MRLSRGLGGLIIVEARKELTAPIAKKVPSRVLGRLVTAPGNIAPKTGAKESTKVADQ